VWLRREAARASDPTGTSPSAPERLNSRGEQPYASRNSRLKCGALGKPQRLAIAEIERSA
jgi:hypothetical protein